MGILNSTPKDEVLEAIEKLRLEIQEMTDGWRNQQSVSNDTMMAKLDVMASDVMLLKRAWEKTK
jgi:hypothetical protein